MVDFTAFGPMSNDRIWKMLLGSIRQDFGDLQDGLLSTVTTTIAAQQTPWQLVNQPQLSPGLGRIRCDIVGQRDSSPLFISNIISDGMFTTTTSSTDNALEVILTPSQGNYYKMQLTVRI